MSLLVTFSVGYFRVHYYDSFLMMHILLCIVLLYSLFFHTSKFTDGEYNVYIWPLVAIWSFDRLLRLARIFHCNLRVNFCTKGAVSCAQSATVRYDSSSDVIRINIQPSASLHPSPGQYYHLYQPFVLRGWWGNHPFSLGAYITPSQPLPQPNEKDISMVTPSANSSKETTAATSNAVPSSITSSTSSSDCTAAPTTFTFWMPLRRLDPSPPRRVPRLPVLRHLAPASSSKALTAMRSRCTSSTLVMIVGGTGIAAATLYVLGHVARLASSTTRTTKMKLVWTAKHAAFLREVCRGEVADAPGRADFEAMLFATGRVSGGVAKAEEAAAEDEIQPAGLAAGREAEVRHARLDAAGIVAEVAKEATESGARTVVFVCGPAAMTDEARAAVHGETKKGCRRIEYIEDCFRW